MHIQDVTSLPFLEGFLLDLEVQKKHVLAELTLITWIEINSNMKYYMSIEKFHHI